MRPYDYAHRTGVRRLGWEDVAALSQSLAEELEGHAPELVVGVARAGIFPAFVTASALRRDLLLVRVSRRVDDEVRFEHPVWRVPIPSTVAGKVVAVVDEIADSGETLEVVRHGAEDAGAGRVLTAALLAHSWADPRPDVVSLVTDFVVDCGVALRLAGEEIEVASAHELRRRVRRARPAAGRCPRDARRGAGAPRGGDRPDRDDRRAPDRLRA